jgi:hypothetical protein
MIRTLSGLRGRVNSRRSARVEKPGRLSARAALAVWLALALAGWVAVLYVGSLFFSF